MCDPLPRHRSRILRSCVAAVGTLLWLGSPLLTLHVAAADKDAPRVSVVESDDFQAALRASKLEMHDIAALKYERLLKEVPLEPAEAAQISQRLVDALLRAGLAEKAQVALTLFEVPESKYWRAQSLLMQRKFKEAEGVLKEYLQKPGAHAARARLALGQAIIGQGRENTGRKELKSLLLHPDPDIAERARILSNESEALSDRALVVLKRLGTTRGSPENEFVKACAWLETGDGKQAEILLRRILEGNEPPPKDLHDATIVRLAEAYAKQPGRARTAERVLLQFLDTPTDSRYMGQAFALLVSLSELDDDDLLENLLEWTAEPEPRTRHAEALFHAGQWYIAHSRGEDAIRMLEMFRTEHPGHEREGEALRALMALYGAQRDDERVLELAKEWRNRFGSGGEDTLDFLSGMIRHGRSEYADAAALFEKSAAAAVDMAQSQRAVYNAGVSRLLDGDDTGFLACVAQLKAPVALPVADADGEVPEPRSKNTEDQAARLLIERALHLAAKRDNGAEAALQEFIKDYPTHPRVIEAHLALAEICLLALPARTKSAGAALDAAEQVPDLSDDRRERLDYVRLWWHEAAGNYEGVTAQGQDFLVRWTASPRRDEVRMKIAQAHYRHEDYARAAAQFEALAEEHADSPYAEVALYFAGRAAALQRTEAGVEKAISLWLEVVNRDGPLKREAQLQQALAKRRQGKEEDALIVIEDLQSTALPDRTEERFTLLSERGELLTLLARKDPKHLDEAVSVFKEIIADPAASRFWRARAGVLLAQSHRQGGRAEEALEACSEVIETSLPRTAISTTPAEFTWIYRAGFMALDLLESKEEWTGAAQLADRLAQAGGERSNEASQRATRLRLEHFLWDK